MNKKRLMSLLLVLIMIFTMYGCSKGNETGTTTDTTEESGDTIELTMWTMHTTEAMIETLEAQVAAFEDQNPNIKIVIETLTYDVVYQRMMAGMNSDTMPNIFNGIEGHIAFMQSQDALVDVSEVIEGMGGREAFVEKYLDWVTKDDVTYAVPDWALYQGVWYRKDLFEENNIEIPKTWEELRAAAEKLTMDTDGDGKTDIYGMSIPMDRNMVAQQTYSQFLYSNGVNIFNPETGKYEFGDKKQQAVEALDMMMTIYNESSPEGSVNWSWTDFRTALAKGEIVPYEERSGFEAGLTNSAGQIESSNLMGTQFKMLY